MQSTRSPQTPNLTTNQPEADLSPFNIDGNNQEENPIGEVEEFSTLDLKTIRESIDSCRNKTNIIDRDLLNLKQACTNIEMIKTLLYHAMFITPYFAEWINNHATKNEIDALEQLQTKCKNELFQNEIPYDSLIHKKLKWFDEDERAWQQFCANFLDKHKGIITDDEEINVVIQSLHDLFLELDIAMPAQKKQSLKSIQRGKEILDALRHDLKFAKEILAWYVNEGHPDYNLFNYDFAEIISKTEELLAAAEFIFNSKIHLSTFKQWKYRIYCLARPDMDPDLKGLFHFMHINRKFVDFFSKTDVCAMAKAQESFMAFYHKRTAPSSPKTTERTFLRMYPRPITLTQTSVTKPEISIANSPSTFFNAANAKAVEDSYAAGLRYLKIKEYDSAYYQFDQAAAHTHIPSMMQLAGMLQKGEGCNIDNLKACWYYFQVIVNSTDNDVGQKAVDSLILIYTAFIQTYPRLHTSGDNPFDSLHSSLLTPQDKKSSNYIEKIYFIASTYIMLFKIEKDYNIEGRSIYLIRANEFYQIAEAHLKNHRTSGDSMLVSDLYTLITECMRTNTAEKQIDDATPASSSPRPQRG